MTPDRWFVLIAGLLLVAFIVWFFWLKRTKGMRAVETSSGRQEVMVLVKGADLPKGETVAVEFLPETPGDYDFACAMGMFRSKLIVE